MMKLCAHTTLFCNHFTLILLFKPQSRAMCYVQLYRRRSPVSFFKPQPYAMPGVQLDTLCPTFNDK